MPATTTTNTDHTSSSSSSSKSATKAKKPVFFWKPNDGNGYLSQWYWSKFSVEGETYVTAEMWMMVHKAWCFGDEETAAQTLAETNQKEHKALGRKVKGFDEGIVTQGTYHKFTISEDAENLRNMLLATGGRELVEVPPGDRVWGVGFKEKDAESNRHRWGQNLLGEALQDIRARLRNEEGRGQV